MRPGTKWVAVFKEPVNRYLHWASYPEPNERVREVFRVGTFQEMDAVLRKLLKRKVPSNRIALAYCDGETLKLRRAEALL